jgi:hypothetical protein
VPAGSTFVVRARPAELLAAPATRRVITALLSEERLDRFAARTGIDPRELTELVFAVHPDGQVVIARGPFDAPFAVREAGQRMAPVESSVDEPMVRRAGFLGSRRVDLAAPADDVVIRIEGTPQLAAAVLSASRHAPEAREHPFREGPSAELRAALGAAPFVLFAPQPLGLPPDTGIGLLLARERALAASAQPSEREEGALALRAELRGEFPPGAHDNFRALARSIATSDLGAALGAQEALPTLRIESEEGRVGLRARIEATVLAAGLRTLLVAEMRELIEGPAAAREGGRPGAQSGAGGGGGGEAEPGHGHGLGEKWIRAPRAAAGRGARVAAG